MLVRYWFELKENLVRFYKSQNYHTIPTMLFGKSMSVTGSNGVPPIFSRSHFTRFLFFPAVLYLLGVEKNLWNLPSFPDFFSQNSEANT